MILVARCFGLGTLAEELREFVAQFETESGCVESRPTERRRQTGAPENNVEAVSRYRKAAAQGSAEAQFRLGDMYFYSWGVPKDYQKAISWYRKAAEQGSDDAQYSLGDMYFYSWGVPQDHQEAISWYRKAAEQGYADAQYSLGQMYFDGAGVPQDYVQAHKWLNLATAREEEYREIDPAEAQSALAESEKVMTDSQVAEAQRLAREWRPTTE